VIKIEVTGASIAEVADKLLAIGSSLKNGAAVWWTQTDAPEKLRQTLRVDTIVDPIMPEVAEAAAAPEPSAGPAAPEPAAETIEAGPSASPATASPSEITAEAMRDLVLRVVREKGRDAMVAVLDTFGAAKASDVPAEQTAELVAALEALL
jgi:hypothetical protein